jgi:hypothetical protein
VLHAGVDRPQISRGGDRPPVSGNGKALRESIGSEVSSHYLAVECVLIDSMVPPEGLRTVRGARPGLAPWAEPSVPGSGTHLRRTRIDVDPHRLRARKLDWLRAARLCCASRLSLVVATLPHPSRFGERPRRLGAEMTLSPEVEGRHKWRPVS